MGATQMDHTSLDRSSLQSMSNLCKNQLYASDSFRAHEAPASPKKNVIPGTIRYKKAIKSPWVLEIHLNGVVG